MIGWIRVLVAALFSLYVTSAVAANFVFDVRYLGNDLTELAPGSDEPIGAMLEVGDTFQWTIAAADDGFWLVETGGGFFPLMAFPVDPGGVRTGDYTLTLSRNGVEVFSESQAGVTTQEVHLGTNTINLIEGLAFDEMFLDYELTAAVDLVMNDPVSTTIESRLPVFGAPESNPFAPGIVYVPEPAALALLASILGGVLARR